MTPEQSAEFIHWSRAEHVGWLQPTTTRAADAEPDPVTMSHLRRTSPASFNNVVRIVRSWRSKSAIWLDTRDLAQPPFSSELFERRGNGHNARRAAICAPSMPPLTHDFQALGDLLEQTRHSQIAGAVLLDHSPPSTPL